MIRTLVDFDQITAAGILARMALALDDEANPASKSVVPNETILRQRVLSELKERLGLRHDDSSIESIERVSEVLDAESDSLIGSVDMEKTLSKLSHKGRLPSDLYLIQVADNVREFYGEKFDTELKLIEQTVGFPDREQHFGGDDDESEGALFSLFTKHYPGKFPFDSFTLLIMGQRRGTLLVVNHVWRIYADRVSSEGISDLVDLLRRFADEFGLLMDVEGNRGKFIVTKDVHNGKPLQKKFEVLPVSRRDKRGKVYLVALDFELTCFSLVTKGHAETAFVAIDTERYRRNLESHNW